MKFVATILAFFLAGCLVFFGQARAPEITRISPTSGPEGTSVAISGKNLAGATTILFGNSPSAFKIISPDKLIALVPHKATSSIISVVTTQGRASSPFAFAILSDPRIPDEVSFRAGYVNPVPAPPGFSSAMLWGIAIADSRASGFQSASVEIASTQLSCRADGKDVVLNDDHAHVRGGLYTRQPWFAGNQTEPMQVVYDRASHAAVLAVGQRPDRIWHFWAASPRVALPDGKLEGCTVRARVKISTGALLQMGMDYWRSPSAPFGNGGNNHEAGASNWYFPSSQWQEAVFTDIGGPQF